MVTTPTDLNSELLTINQAAKYLKCSRVFLWQQRKKGQISTINVGKKKLLIPKASIDAFLKLNQKEGEK